ncbi:MAG: DUF438 domain-containing protein [Chitinivibrionia bacterium]|nr:DUF438 domain-containing protein [Chitinivibrionia bacterium]
MSELIQDKLRRKDLLKHMIRQLHAGEAPEAVRRQLVRLLGQVPYDEVVEVEQELISEGMPVEEVLRLCDVHTEAMRGAIDTAKAPEAPPGHPVHTFRQENKALRWELEGLRTLYESSAAAGEAADAEEMMKDIRGHFNALMDVEKHYRRKENLLFPFLEKHGVTGPPTVMWGKHDEARELLKAAIETLESAAGITPEEAQGVIELVLKPASGAVSGMIDKEEQILLPMCLDTLDETEWYEIYRASDEIGYCLCAPETPWRPEGAAAEPETSHGAERIHLPTGSFTTRELESVLNTIPFDVTFVDVDDTVRYFSHGRERIFSRSRAILGRKVQYCHPPKSVDVVRKILDDFHSGRESHAHFWIELHGRFISIEYFALRGAGGEYLGTLEVSQDLTKKRALTGQQRLLSYVDKEN